MTLKRGVFKESTEEEVALESLRYLIDRRVRAACRNKKIGDAGAQPAECNQGAIFSLGPEDAGRCVELWNLVGVSLCKTRLPVAEFLL